MNTEANKAVNEVIVELSKYIKKVIESDSASNRDQLPSLVEALAKLKY